MGLSQILSWINESFTCFVVFPAILVLGIYLSVRLRFVQFTQLRRSIKELFQKDEGNGKGITQYQAVAAVLAGNFGTGNISGMAVAIAMGGPGALVWMWVIAFLGSTIQYASCILGVKYRAKNGAGEPVGGPMYYLDRGLGKKKLGAVFAVFALLGGITAGNFTQVNSMALPLAGLGVPPLATGLVVAVLVGAVLLGGMGRFAKTAASVVPVMAALYFSAAAWIVFSNVGALWPALKVIGQAAVHPAAFAGGAMGFGLMQTISTGFDRGIFATDAGTGVAPILQASTASKDPIANGLVTLIAPVLVMVVCTMTGLVIVMTGSFGVGLESTNMVTHAFSKGSGSALGGSIVTLSLLLFSYTTILAWATCGERAVEYLFGSRWTTHYRWFFLAMVPIGALLEVTHVWLLSDISFSLMLAINMIGVAGLAKEVIRDSNGAFVSTKT